MLNTDKIKGDKLQSFGGIISGIHISTIYGIPIIPTKIEDVKFYA